LPKATSDETKRIKDRANANANRMQGQTPHKIRGIAKTTSDETKRIKDRANANANRMQGQTPHKIRGIAKSNIGRNQKN
jgi:hypothetical protein